MPFGLPISDEMVFSSEAPTIAGTTTIDSAIYDLQGYSGIVFIVRLGTPAANNNIRVQQDSDSAGGTMADLTGTLVASGANNTCIAEVVHPGGAGSLGERYARCRVTRGTSTTIDSLIAIRFGARSKPTTQPSGVSLETHIGPVEGTA